MPVKGDFAKLHALAGQFAQLGVADSEVRMKISQRLGAAAMKQLNDEFRQERDPYGKAWAPLSSTNRRIAAHAEKLSKAEASLGRAQKFSAKLRANTSYAGTNVASIREEKATARVDKLRKKHPLILQDTGRMRNSFSAQPTSTGFQVVTSVDYAKYHQYGTKHMPRRQLIPETNTGGLGPLWGSALETEATTIIQQLFARTK